MPLAVHWASVRQCVGNPYPVRSGSGFGTAYYGNHSVKAVAKSSGRTIFLPLLTNKRPSEARECAYFKMIAIRVRWLFHNPCLASRVGGVSGGNETQVWADSSHTAIVGAGKLGSAKFPMATAINPGKPSLSQ
jgi:hypothetical protein